MLRRTDSLDTLLQAATNPENAGPAMSAVEAFARSVNEVPEGARSAVRLIASKIQSQHEWEAMQALHVLEFCMQMCGKAGFVTEVAKFRFLNEMIKLVSPKYLGNHTSPSVKTRVLEMLFTWTHLYPGETKIQEAYDMLRKQGVVTEDHVPSSTCTIVPLRQSDKSSVFEDDEKSRLLRRLLQSKHPDDLQAANRLIKSMVREDEKRTEKQSKVLSTLEQVQNNSQLLAEMLAHYDKARASSADTELISELHQACEKLRPNLSQVADDCDEATLADVLQASDDLTKILEDYHKVVICGEKLQSEQVSLLDLASPSENGLSEDLAQLTVSEGKTLSDSDQLREVFTSTAPILPQPTLPSNPNLPSPLVPVVSESQVDTTSHLHFVTSVLDTPALNSQKITKKPPSDDPLKSLDLDFLVQSKFTEALNKKQPESAEKRMSSGDDTLLDVCTEATSADNSKEDEALLDMDKPPERESEPPAQPEPSQEPQKEMVDCKTLLSNLHVTLESIKPSSKPPVIALDQTDGIVVTLHIAQNSPRPGVRVIVVSILSKVQQPITNLTFQAVIPDKSCKLRLQSASTTELGAFNPFLPPPAATQLLLVANPSGAAVSLKFMLSYCVDGDVVTEMGEVENLVFEL